MRSMSHKNVGMMFVLSILLIYPLPQVAIDIYLPSWPFMINALHTSKFLLQTSLTVYILCLGAAQLVYGPLSDRFGRKPPLLFGIALFFASSFAIQYATTVTQLLILRALQGLGIGCGFTIGSAILADVFAGKKLAKMTSYSAMVYSLSLILAPLVGSYVQHYIGWRANFTLMAVYALVLFCLIVFFVSETAPTKQVAPITLAATARGYFSLLRQGNFIRFVLCLILAYGTMIAFNIIAPFLFQENLHVSVTNYGKLILIVGTAYFIGATINSQLIGRFKIYQLIFTGLILMLLSGIGLLIITLAGLINATSVICLVSITLLSLGFVYPNCFACALDVCTEKGCASALIGSAILIGVSAISLLVSHYNVHPDYCLAISYLILSSLSILTWIWR